LFLRFARSEEFLIWAVGTNSNLRYHGLNNKGCGNS
jgi:hypothetical protein